MYFMLTTHPNLNAKFVSQILNLHVDFIKYAVEKVDWCPQVSNILKSFPMTELSVNFENLHKVKLKLTFSVTLIVIAQ